jgi:hypothetical protein
MMTTNDVAITAAIVIPLTISFRMDNVPSSTEANNAARGSQMRYSQQVHRGIRNSQTNIVMWNLARIDMAVGKICCIVVRMSVCRGMILGMVGA